MRWSAQRARERITLCADSFLSNLRTPPSVLASQAAVTIAEANASTELHRLATDFAHVKVLTVANLAQLALSGTSLYERGVLSHHTARQIEAMGLHSIGGSWCCKPARDAGPNNYHFRLRILPEHPSTD